MLIFWGGGGGVFVGFEPSGQTLGMLIFGGEVPCGDWERVRWFRDRYGGVLGKSLEILILEGVRGLGPEIGNIDTGGSVWGRGYGQIQVIGYVNIVVPGEGLEP